MKKIAIVSAAGWKGSGKERGLPGCPECFLPLGDGTTSLYRNAKVAAKLGFEVYVAIGELGYRYREYHRHTMPGHYSKFLHCAVPGREIEGFSMDDSPWTQERFNYASQLGTVVELPNPGPAFSHDTFCFVADTLDDWDQLLLARGDMLLSLGYLERILTELPWPSMYTFNPNHAYFLFDKKGMVAYRNQLTPVMRSGWALLPRPERGNVYARMPDGHPQGTTAMKHAGVAIYGGHNGPRGKWMDIDTSESYTQALQWVADGTLAWQEDEDEDE